MRAVKKFILAFILLAAPFTLAADVGFDAVRGAIADPVGNRDSGITINKFGWTPDCDTGSAQIIWDGGATPKTYTYLTTASSLYLSSTDNSDDQDYEVHGLDENWDTQEVTITAIGNTFVAVTGLWMRVFRAINVGSSDSSGDIYISSSKTDADHDGIPDDTSAIKAKITSGNNQTLMAMYTIPNGYTGYITKWYASVGKSEDVEVGLWVRPFGTVFNIKDKQLMYQVYLERLFYPQLKILQKSDIYVTCEMISNSNNEISAGFDIILEKN